MSTAIDNQHKDAYAVPLQLFKDAKMTHQTLQQYKLEVLKDPRSKKLNFEPDGLKHEVYRITHIKDSKHYYGSKSNQKCLGESYFSSSTDEIFINEQKEFPEMFKYKIIKTYDNQGDKIIHEAFLHHKFDVKNHAKFYNKANQTPFGFDTTGKKLPEKILKKLQKRLKENNPFKGRKHSVKTKEILRKKNLGKTVSEETKMKHKLRKRNKHSEETKKKIGKGNKGKKVPEKARIKMSASKKKHFQIFQ